MGVKFVDHLVRLVGSRLVYAPLLGWGGVCVCVCVWGGPREFNIPNRFSSTSTILSVETNLFIPTGDLFGAGFRCFTRGPRVKDPPRRAPAGCGGGSLAAGKFRQSFGRIQDGEQSPVYVSE